MKNVLVIQHSPIETLGQNFETILDESGFFKIRINIFDMAPDFERFNEPRLKDLSLIIVLGGPQSANDNFPAFVQEQELLKEAIYSGKPVFGICLGAQMMSVALGGTVTPCKGYSIGLRKIEVTEFGESDPVFSQLKTPLVFALHGECYSLPEGADLLADGVFLQNDSKYSRINMAFKYGTSYGFQFEPQLTLEEFLIWNQEMVHEYDRLGPQFDPKDKAASDLREFTSYSRIYECQMGDLFRTFLDTSVLT